ncbi:MAG: SUMF1/EgtB/PvdO family nonheme iron enzyme [Nitrospira sp.]|nr:SUMF1/EgtB/PvdO family nonheme iron enzyme [Nitrospira sp.]
MALANVGTWLYQRGRRVLLIDWDLEAPGLESFFFHDENKLCEIRSRPGLIDLIESYRQLWSLVPGSGDQSHDPRAKATAITDKLGAFSHLLIPLGETTESTISTRFPGLWLLHAGCRAGDSELYYTKTVNAMEWGRFYEELGGFVFLEWFRRQVASNFDIILIDSRTGITEMGGVCTQHMADIAVLLFAPNYTNLYGIRKISDILLDPKLHSLRGGARPITIFPIPSRVDTQGATNELEEFEKQFKREFSEFEQIDINWCWGSRIPYVSTYSYQEEILFGSHVADGQMGQAYERIGQRIALQYDESLSLAERGAAVGIRGAPQFHQRVDTEGSRRTIQELTTAAQEKIDQRDFAVAESLLRSAVSLANPDLGSEHSDTLRAMSMLAAVLNYQRKFSAARDLWAQLVGTCCRVLGDADPLSTTAMNNLALTLQSQGDFHSAQQWFERVLSLRLSILGEEHPDTLSSMNDLSEILAAQGKLDRAKTLQEQVLTARRRILGEEHPDTLISMSSLSETLCALGDLDGARSFQERVVAVRRRILGAEHPDTIKAISNLITTLRIAKSDEEIARSLAEELHQSRRGTVPTIYLSSTYEDLKDYRRVVNEILRKAGHQVIAMEDYVAADQRPVQKCLDDVARADVYVGIIGFRYGYVPPSHLNPEGLSITELEFRHAEQLKKPCLMFLADETASRFSPQFVDVFTGDGSKGQQIKRLRDYLGNEKTASFFSEPYQLASLVQAAVSTVLEKNDKQHGPNVKYPPPSPQIIWNIEKDGSPYPGLMYFTGKYAPVFFGRDREVNELILRMSEPGGRFLIISGASGAGKSSLVAAGLWQALVKEGRLPGSQQWKWLRITPGADSRGPLASLSAGLQYVFSNTTPRVQDLAVILANDPLAFSKDITSQLSYGQELVLFVDQLEELFTSGFREPDIQNFLEQLISAAQSPASRLRVVAAIRSELLGKLVEYESMLPLLNSPYLYHLGPVSPRMLQDMIEKPAQATGYRFESGLVEQILNDAGQEPGNLPLVAHALKQLSEMRKDGTFTAEAYRSMGGVVGAIATRTNEVLSKLPEGLHGAYERVFAELVHIERDRPPTRKRARLSDFKGDEEADKVLRVLAGQECQVLVIADKGQGATVEVAHEKLFSAWPKLKHWIEASGEALRDIDHAEEEARRWQKGGDNPQELWLSSRAKKVSAAIARFGKNISQELRRFLSPQEVLIEKLDHEQLSHQDRLLIGQKLAEFGDLRPGVGLRAEGLPDIVWIEIPGGEVKLEEVNRKFEVKPFRMAKYLVTNEQFDVFLKAEDGYRNEEWWSGIKRSQEAQKSSWQEANSPRETVSWYEAMAFCRWLGAKTRTSIRLATEWEWQQAVTGGDPMREYPWEGRWDGSRCNSSESRLHRTTMVGLYPHGATEQGLMDMVGNVWEWCLNEYDNPEPRKTLSNDNNNVGRRVLRGGSWCYGQENLRALNRFSYTPDARLHDFGFRLAQDLP